MAKGRVGGGSKRTKSGVEGTWPPRSRAPPLHQCSKMSHRFCSHYALEIALRQRDVPASHMDPESDRRRGESRTMRPLAIRLQGGLSDACPGDGKLWLDWVSSATLSFAHEDAAGEIPGAVEPGVLVPAQPPAQCPFPSLSLHVKNETAGWSSEAFPGLRL